METATLDRTATDASTIFDRAVCLSVTLGRLGVRRKINVSELQPKAEVATESVSASKELLDCPEYDAIRQGDRALRSFLEKRTSGPALFKSGTYMLSYQVLPEVNREVENYFTRREVLLVPAFAAVYDKARAEARGKLKDLYREEDYPALEAVKRAFYAEVRYFKMGTPDKLASVDPDAFEREKAKTAAQWAEVLEESRQVLRQQFSELVDHLVERLEPGPDGQPKKRFTKNLVDKMNEFLTTFDPRNIGDDAELATWIQRAREALDGVTPESIRSRRGTRDSVVDAFTRIKAAVDPMVENRPKRRFNAGDEE